MLLSGSTSSYYSAIQVYNLFSNLEISVLAQNTFILEENNLPSIID